MGKRMSWLEPVFLIWLVNMLAAFAIGNAYGQDKVRLEMRNDDG